MSSACHWPDCRFTGACDYQGQQCGIPGDGLPLAELVDLRLRLAGFTRDDPALARIRRHNELVALIPPGRQPRRRDDAAG